VQGPRTHSLPGVRAFPESIGVDPSTGRFYTGSLIDGTVYRGSLDASDCEVFLREGTDGRTAVAGVKVDAEGRIWLADAYNGRVLVYGDTGRLVHASALSGPGKPTVNDIAFSGDLAYVTDSSRPYLYRVELAAISAASESVVEPWLEVEPRITYSSGDGPFGVNLNGIVTSADGRLLLTVQTNSGRLFRIETEGQRIDEVVVEGAGLLFGDGLLRLDETVYVARNAANQIVRLHLGPDWISATSELLLEHNTLAFPTALASLGGRLLVVNSQLNAGANAKLPFAILDFALPEDGTGA
jgi:Cu-Zn family superoxide dismutase